MSVIIMGLLDKMCDAILGENQSESDDYNYYVDDHRNDYSRENRQSDKVRVSWRGYYRSTDGGVHEAIIDEVIPETTWYRLCGSCELTKQFLMRKIFDCVELESSAPSLTFGGYV